MSYSAILLPQLNQTDSKIQINKSESTWIGKIYHYLNRFHFYQTIKWFFFFSISLNLASLVTIFLPVGSFIVGPLMDRFGRRKIALLTCIPIFISWMLMYMATDIWFIFIARIIAGISAGGYLFVYSFAYELKIVQQFIQKNNLYFDLCMSSF